MSKIDELFEAKRRTPSDINEHMATLYNLALECDTIAEFGVRSVVSSYAFAKARPKKLICVDINKDERNVNLFLQACKEENISVEFFIADSRTFQMENVDLIFIDTLHNYTQLKQELIQLGNKANKYLVFHDTITFGHTDEVPETTQPSNPTPKGLVPAIAEFLKSNSHWKEKHTYANCNGLTILQRNL